MNTELNKQCVIALGWIDIEDVNDDGTTDGSNPDPVRLIGIPPGYAHISRLGGSPFHDVPDFRADPNATRLLEDEIERRGLQKDYLAALCRVLGFSSDGVSGDPKHFDFSTWLFDLVDEHELWKLLRATPPQRAAAFVEAMKGES